MPRRKSSPKLSKQISRRAAGSQDISSEGPDMTESKTYSAVNPALPTRVPRLFWAIPLILIILAALLWKNRGLIVAATVNNQPIWRLSLEQRLNQRYGSQMLDEMLNEQILSQEAAKRGISVSSKEIDDKISEIEKSLNGKITLSDALAQQGMTIADFRNQVAIQLTIDKLTASSAVVTDQEVTAYIEKNKDTLTATDEAGLKLQARAALMQEKKSQSFQKLFGDLKKNAKVVKFI